MAKYTGRILVKSNRWIYYCLLYGGALFFQKVKTLLSTSDKVQRSSCSENMMKSYIL